MTALATAVLPAAEPFNPDARSYAAYRLSDTRLLGTLLASTLGDATAEATERWPWDRGDRLGIVETGQEDAPLWPFPKQPVNRLHIYAIRRSAPIAYRPSKDQMRQEPIYRFNLDHICTVDLRQLGASE